MKVRKKFSNDVVKCIIQLVGELLSHSFTVPRLYSAFQNVRSIVTDLKELPSERSNLRMVDRGHGLAKYHIADSIIKSDGVDYHTDATTRHHRKYLGTQVTLSSGNIPVG